MRIFILLAIMFGCLSGLMAQSFTFRGEIVDIDLPWNTTPAPSEQGLSEYFRLIHFSDLPDARRRAKMSNKGIRFIQYIGHRSYVIGVSNELSVNYLKENNVITIRDIHHQLKLSKKLKERPVPEYAIEGDLLKLIVKGYDGVPHSQFVRLFSRQGIKLTYTSKATNYVEILIAESDIESMALQPEISFLDWITPPSVRDDDNGRAMHRSNLLHSSSTAGLQFDGTGVNVLVRDDGPVGPHIDFQGRVDQAFPFPDPSNTHGDMVAGIFGGAGNREPTYQGMASGAFLFVRNYSSTFLDYTMDLHQNEGVLVTSSSYSNGCNDGYTAITRTVDDQVYQNPSLIHLFSAGNSGNSDCGYGVDGWGNITGGHKQGKNVIATGNMDANESLVSSSSRGPAHDGRVKPDICAHGAGQLSTDPDHEYAPGGGTSAASPGAAGVFTQLIQAYRSLNSNQNPNTGFIKACILNSGKDLGNPGPDFEYGWGGINGNGAYQIIKNNHYFQGSVGHNQATSHTVSVPSGSTEVRFMLYWMDPPAAEGAEIALINNLDVKVVTPANDTLLPWILDPTPDEGALMSLAAPGIDALNNMEQVKVENPSGNYQIIINGTTVPMGPQEYFLVYYLVEEPLASVFPNGGESFEPGTQVRLFWDTYLPAGTTYTIDASYDNGSSWQGVVNTSNHHFLWDVPATPTGQGKIRISASGYSTENTIPFSIMQRPANVSVDSVCVDEIFFQWDPVPNAAAYNLHILGEKYMDSVATTTETHYRWPITNFQDTVWYAVKAKGANGMFSERSYAQVHFGGLISCPMDNDIAVIENGIVQEEIEICEETRIPINITVRNMGLNAINSFTVFYQLNNGPVNQMAFNELISQNENYTWVTNDSIHLQASGSFILKSWVETAVDQYEFNNTLSSDLYVTYVNNLASEVMEDFNDGVFPKAEWKVTGNVDDYDWQVVQAIGADGNTALSLWVDNYNLNYEGQALSVETPILEINTSDTLSFDYAYIPYSPSYSDSLLVEAFEVCVNMPVSDTIFFLGGDDLRTAQSGSSNEWYPDSAADWGRFTLDLSAYAGKAMKFRFSNINGWGNSLFLDNINKNSIQPVSIQASATEGCPGEMVVCSATDNSNSTYQWDFHNDGNLVSGQGPHQVVFESVGTHTITLYFSQNGMMDTIYMDYDVLPLPIADYNFDLSGLMLTAANQSQHALTYHWSFGDGETSDLANPVHTYSEEGDYWVELIASGTCGSDTMVHLVNVVNINDISNRFPELHVFPNPMNNQLNLKNSSAKPLELQLELLDVVGRKLLRQSMSITPKSSIVLPMNHLPSGQYFLKISERDRFGMTKLVKTN